MNKFAVILDIHSNIWTLESVLLDAKHNKAAKETLVSLLRR